MLELIAIQMANALRKCGDTIVCDGCPYQSLGAAKCIQKMQRDAAAMIEGQRSMIDLQASHLSIIQGQHRNQ